MNKDELNKQIRKWKQDHRIENVMQELGESFDRSDSKKWRGLVTPGLVVDIDKQSFELTRNGEAITGDLYAWLKKVKGFRHDAPKGSPSITRYLDNRKPDPQSAAQPVKVKQETKVIRHDEDLNQPLDHWQEKALLIGGEVIRKYFAWSWISLSMYAPRVRLAPVHIPSETHCMRCDAPFHWHFEKTMIRADDLPFPAWREKHAGEIPVIAYSIQRRLKVTDYTQDDHGELDELLNALLVEEDDGIVCVSCAFAEYDFQIALELCVKSAWEREEVEEKQTANEP